MIFEFPKFCLRLDNEEREGFVLMNCLISRPKDRYPMLTDFPLVFGTFELHLLMLLLLVLMVLLWLLLLLMLWNLFLSWLLLLFCCFIVIVVADDDIDAAIDTVDIFCVVVVDNGDTDVNVIVDVVHNGNIVYGTAAMKLAIAVVAVVVDDDVNAVAVVGVLAVLHAAADIDVAAGELVVTPVVCCCGDVVVVEVNAVAVAGVRCFNCLNVSC